MSKSVNFALVKIYSDHGRETSPNTNTARKNYIKLFHLRKYMFTKILEVIQSTY